MDAQGMISRLVLMLMPVFLFAKGVDALTEANYFYDANQVRYELYQTNGQKPYNWLFLPGGPGVDSRYYRELVDILDLPGNVWLIDLPGNGDNVSDCTTTDFDKWFEIFPSVVKKFDNPILVGHSFGGMFPLCFPELEKELKAFVILNSAPSLWLEAAAVYAKQFNLPDLSKELQELMQNPSQETLKSVLNAGISYYFPVSTRDKGRQLFSQLPMQYLPAAWWQKKAMEMHFSAKWVPQHVPTLIIGGKYDGMCPFSLFEKDRRFQRENIQLRCIENAGHFPWIENPQEVQGAFEEFSSQLLQE
jgi:pimeloyl-ACP methyl ester carboxylesterase